MRKKVFARDIAGLYTRTDVAKMLRIDFHQYTALERQMQIPPPTHKMPGGARSYYNAEDVAEIKKKFKKGKK